jgi:hypothetical protein
VAVVCNKPASADELLAGLQVKPDRNLQARLARLRARPAFATLTAARRDPQYAEARQELAVASA